MDSESENVTSAKWESVRDSFANASKNGWVAFKLQVLMRGTFIHENASMPKTVVTRDNISSSEEIVSKCLFPKAKHCTRKSYWRWLLLF